MSIYVWGTGCGASELLDAGLDPADIAAFVDSFPVGDSFLGRPVILPEQLNVSDCSLLIVTTRQADAIAQTASALGIPEEILLYMKNHHLLTDRNRSYRTAERILGRGLLDRIVFPAHMVRQNPLVTHELSPQQLENDYVRLATLELLCRRLEGISGACAELGVYKGAFARCINALMPNRKLYLFDSFDGFEPGEAARETGSEAFLAAHCNTNAERVVRSMPHPDQILTRVGFFPGTAAGLEERFCLVSLDADFEETTLEGLRYFWPRMSSGGYVLLHDYHSALAGIANAVSRYESELGHKLPAVPLCDIGGSLILCKP